MFDEKLIWKQTQKNVDLRELYVKKKFLRKNYSVLLKKKRHE